jgi:hypothetical protein
MRKYGFLIGLMILASGLLSASIFVQPSQVITPLAADDPQPTPTQPSMISAGTLPCDPSAVHGLYFYSTDCSHCVDVLNNVLLPMENDYGTKMDIRLVEINYPDNYELLINAEEHFGSKRKTARSLP